MEGIAITTAHSGSDRMHTPVYAHDIQNADTWEILISKVLFAPVVHLL